MSMETWAYMILLNIVLFGGLWLVGKGIERLYAYLIENYDEFQKTMFKK